MQNLLFIKILNHGRILFITNLYCGELQLNVASMIGWSCFGHVDIKNLDVMPYYYCIHHFKYPLVYN
jgi:hypothetical protein